MEHLHADDEVRFILDGSGYFDIRDPEDRWIRLVIGKCDLISLPAGIYSTISFISMKTNTSKLCASLPANQSGKPIIAVKKRTTVRPGSSIWLVCDHPHNYYV